MNKIPTCHPDKSYYSNNLCKQCYNRRPKTPEQKEAHRLASKKYYDKYKLAIHRQLWERKQSNWKERIVENLYRGVKARAISKGIEFNISISDIVIPEICPVLGIPLGYGIGKNNPSSVSIDRIDNKKGYTKDNIIVISMRANRLKSDATLEELQKISSFYTTRYSKTR